MYLISLPRLGQTMEAGTITNWYQEQGQEFDEEDLLYEVETDKMTTDVEAKDGGTLVKVLIPENQEVPVGTVLAVGAHRGEVVGDEDLERFLLEHGLGTGQSADPATAVAAAADTPAAADTAPADTASAGAAPEEEPAAAEPEDGGAANTSADTPVGATDPSAGAADRSIAAARGTVPETDRPARIPAVPKARALAKERGIDLREVTGTGINGTVRVADLDHGRAASAGASSGPPRVATRVPMTGMVKAMADAMTRSWSEVPQFVQQTSADATALRARLKRLRYEGLALTYTDLLIGATAAAATEVPEVNASVSAQEITRYDEVNVSVAMASERGLMVPVVRDAARRSITEIATETRRLAAAVESGKVGPADSSHGTISLSNLGAYGVDTGTPVVNAPQAAIVFVGAIRDEVVAVDGRPEVQLRIHFSVAFDHRAVDGMTGARFTSALKARIEAGG